MSRYRSRNRMGWLVALASLFLFISPAENPPLPAAIGQAKARPRSAPSPKPASQDSFPPTGQDPLSPKQRRDLLKHNFEKMKRDADELLELAKSLQQELDESNENVLSLRIIDRAEKIERLAKSIRNTAKGY